MTAAAAIAALRDAIRDDLVAELTEKLEAWRGGLSDDTDQSYLDGIGDAILILQGA